MLKGLTFVSARVFHPVFVVGNIVGEKFGGLGSYFVSKNSLFLENENLKAQLALNNALMSNYDSVLTDDASLKEILGRLPAQAGKDLKADMVLAAILAKPNVSPYDTLLIDAGINSGIQMGNMVFALGDVPIGRVDTVLQNSAKVTLFSTAGEKTQVVVGDKNVFLEAVGRGGGNFEMNTPRDFIMQKGDKVVLPGIMPHVLAITETTISDPRDPFIKALLVSPVNIQELKFVEIELNK